MKIKTVRDLKNMLNSINDNRVLDSEIKFCFEDDGYGIVGEGAWFDLQQFGYTDYPTITICKEKEDLASHEGRTPWTSLSEWLDEREEWD